MISLKAVLDAVADYIRQYLDEALSNGRLDSTVYGVWQSTEANDPSLSVIEVHGNTQRGVPKYAHVTGLVAGDVVECLHSSGNKPLTIIGKPVGNISLT